MDRLELRRAFHRLMLGAAEYAGSLVMPRRCVFCGVTSEAGEFHICAGCFDDLPWNRHSCPACAAAVPAGSEALCAACQAEPPPFSAAVVPLEYRFPVDTAIKAFKFRRKLFYGPAFAEVLVAAASRLPPDVDALLPVPLHRWRQFRRGFNQAEELARPVSRATGLPLLSNVRRAVATAYQSGLSARERRRNLKDAFHVAGRLGAAHIAIVDDVITSGATCRQLAAVLQECGAAKVSELAVARA